MLRNLNLILLICILFVVVSTTATNASWTHDGIPVSLQSPEGGQPVNECQFTPDGSGGAIITWVDERNGEYDIYAQRIDASGNILWTESGVAVCTAVGIQHDPVITSDGSGGALIAWWDKRDGNPTEDFIFAQRVNNIGERLWYNFEEGDYNGITAVDSILMGNRCSIISDDAGGAYIFWEEYDDLYDARDIRAARVSSGGVVLWDEWGIVAISGLDLGCVSTSTEYSVASDGANGAFLTTIVGCQTTDIYVFRINTLGDFLPGVPVCTGMGDQRLPGIITDGSGGAVIAWHDNRNGNEDIFAQRVDSTCTTLWTANGIAICTDTGNQEYPKITSDSSHGAIITWRDERNGVYSQRVNASGTVLWTANGVAICTQPESSISPIITSDNLGGAIITWNDKRNGYYNRDIFAQLIDSTGVVQWAVDGSAICNDVSRCYLNGIITDESQGALIVWIDERGGEDEWEIYAQQVDHGGVSGWTTNGVEICSRPTRQCDPQITSNDESVAIITWEDTRLGNRDIFAQRMDSEGAALWADGVGVCIDPAPSRLPKIISDGSLGTVIAWEDYRSGQNWDIYAQKLDPSGTTLWTAGGVAVCTATGDQALIENTALQIISDDAGGAIFAWKDYRGDMVFPPDSADIYAQRVDFSGTVMWPVDGLAICTAVGDQSNHRITADGSGGVILTWQDARGSGAYAQRVNSNGDVQWAADGIEICTAARLWGSPDITTDGTGGAIIVWIDIRNSNCAIYAQRIDTDGNALWAPEGVACTETGDKYLLQVTSDNAGGAVIMWDDEDYNIYSQRVDSAGIVLWVTSGVTIYTASGPVNYHQITSDGAGGAIITWGGPYAQRVNDNGSVAWTAGGIYLCTEVTKKPKVISDGVQGAIVTWEDYRSTYPNIYAQRIEGIICEFQPAEIDFETVNILEWKDLSFTITCDADFGLLLNGNVSEPCNEFEIISGAGPYSLATGETHEVEVRFNPIREGTQICSIETGVLCADVICTGIGRGPACEVYPSSIAVPDPVPIGCTTCDTFFTITNIGGGTLTGNVIENCDDHFSITSGSGPFMLYPGESDTVVVSFAPSIAGSHQCTVETGVYLCSEISVTGFAYECPPDSLVYVDADAAGAGDGSSWADAYTELRDALLIMSQCPTVTEIWVAEGTYTPTGSTDRSATFRLQDSLSIYGGFNGTETLLSERDIKNHPTILSGDIGVPADSTDNSYHVVTGDSTNSTAVLDGFTITKGRADVAAPDSTSKGGGIYISSGSPTLVNLILLENTASYRGGGNYNDGSNPTLINVLFSGNYAPDGGGMLNNSSDPTLINVTFSDNIAVFGGGMSNRSSSNPVLTNTILWGDSAITGYPEIRNVLGTPVISYSLIEGSGGSGAWDSYFGTNGGNNIDADPLYINAPVGNYRLGAGSPAINAGYNDPSLPSTDLDGNDRIVDGTVDMGAYEDLWIIAPLALAVSPRQVDFDMIPVGSTRDTTFVIKNIGGSSGAIDVNVIAAGSYYNILSGGGSHSLAPGESLVVSVRYAPVSPGQHECVIETNSSVCNRLAFIADRPDGLKIVDVGNPADPTLIGAYDTPGLLKGIHFSDNLAFIADWQYGLQVIDVYNPAAPVFKGTYDTPEYAENVYAAGDLAFVADRASGIQIIDISNPATPTLSGSYDTPGDAYNVFVSGNYAYVADYTTGLQIIDISNPASPTFAGAYDTPGYSFGVYVLGDYAYMADETSGLQVIDVSNPVSPTFAGSCGTSNALGVYVQGTYAFIADGGSGLRVIDISNPTSMTVDGSYDTPGYSYDVHVVGDYAYVADGGSGLQVIDISEPTAPVLSGTYDLGSARDVTVIPWGEVAITGFAGYEYALIDSVVDVTDDQGGQVRVHMMASIYDLVEEVELPIASYQIWRRMDDPVALQAIVSASAVRSDGEHFQTAGDAIDENSLMDWPLMEWDGRYFVQSTAELMANGFPPGTWEIVENISPTQQQYYIVLTPTLADSSDSGTHWNYYVTTAHTTNPSIWFTSPPDSGYSVDNIAPGVPLGFAVAYNTGSGNQLTWDPSPEPDFQYYRVYRGDSENFVPDPGNLVHETAMESWTDPEYDGWDVHYKITALDYVGNESDPASPESITGEDIPSVPKAFALYQNVPNPFNPTTMIRFDLPRAVQVKLCVYNVKGELIATLVDQQMTGGRKEVSWSAKDSRGRAISSGIYFYRLVAGDFVQTRKMVLLR